MFEVKPNGSIRPTRVLFIEDNLEQVELVKANLQEFGHGDYLLEWAGRLMEGIERLGQGDFDVVLLDLGLPESDGPDSYLAVRDKARNVPVIVFTADPREHTVHPIIAYGAEGYLLKQEASGPRLIESIRNATSRHKANSAPPSCKFDGVAWQLQPTAPAPTAMIPMRAFPRPR